MIALKKNIARLVLQGIGILGLLFGFSVVYFTIAMLFTIRLDDMRFLPIWLLCCATMLVLGGYLTYASYLILRRRPFAAIESISVVLAFSVFSVAEHSIGSFATTMFDTEQARHAEQIVGFASFFGALLLSVLVYSISKKLLIRLARAAYGPEDTPGVPHAPDKQ